MKEWDYAELSRWAKENGGPMKAIETIAKYNKDAGIKEMIPIAIIASMAAFIAGWAVAKIQELKESNKISEEEYEEAMQEVQEFMQKQKEES